MIDFDNCGIYDQYFDDYSVHFSEGRLELASICIRTTNLIENYFPAIDEEKSIIADTPAIYNSCSSIFPNISRCIIQPIQH